MTGVTRMTGFGSQSDKLVFSSGLVCPYVYLSTVLVCPMCLILFAINANERWQLVVAANRDEHYDRASQAADFWAEAPLMLAGRDQVMGGTWLGITKTGRFSAVTNYYEPPPDPVPKRSRGELPYQYLNGGALHSDALHTNTKPAAFIQQLAQHSHEYRGFNLLLGDGDDFYYYGNRRDETKKLDPGCYGISNQHLDCSWPKVIQGRRQLATLLSSTPPPTSNTAAALVTALFKLLADKGDERDFSTNFISGDTYGTRAATVVLVATDGSVSFEERAFGPMGKPLGISKHHFNL